MVKIKFLLPLKTKHYQQYLVVSLMYGCGLPMNEVLNLRVKDIDFGFDKVYVWDSKSLKDRSILLATQI